MTSLLELYADAENAGIDVDWFSMEQAPSLSAVLPDGQLCIALDPWKIDSIAYETTALAHELGHCATGSFYNLYAACDVREKHEHRADKWAIDRLIGKENFWNAIRSGCTELWDLAEFFGVTEDFMRRAACWYRFGNLAADAYL